MEDYRKHIVPHLHTIGKEDRIQNKGFIPKVIWLVGLSGSGKSTLASGLESHLHKLGFSTYILDGDNVRSGLNKDLDFSEESRVENIRRISEVARLFIDAGVIVLTAFISPFEKDRNQARALIGGENFIEIFVDCPLEVCESRDVKGLYKKARAGEIKNFTGIDSPFEAPTNSDLTVDTSTKSLEESLYHLINQIEPLIRV